MILQSLVRYYEILSDDPESGIARPGYSVAKVSFAAVLSPQGELLELMPLKIEQPRGKSTREVPRSMAVPEQMKKTVGIASNFLCENAGYLFGLDTKGKPERAQRCFEAFRELHLRLLQGVDSPEARAIVSFVNSWEPSAAPSHPALEPFMEELCAGANLVFELDGAHRFAHEAPELREAWEQSRRTSESGSTAQCLVSGKVLPAARLHPDFRGVRGAQSSGASLVSFNARAYESYGKDELQGLNAPVSEYAAFAYGTALRYLLAEAGHRQQLGDTTVVFWAEHSGHRYEELYSLFSDPPLGRADASRPLDGREADEQTAHTLSAMFRKIAEGQPASQGLEQLDADVQFCILGLSPNAARLSVRFFLTDRFVAIIDRIGQHYMDLQLQHAPFEPDCFPLWKLMAETVPEKSSKGPSEQLSGAVLRAILTGQAYPQALYQSILLRIHAEHEVNYYKAAILKACLLRMKLPAAQVQVLGTALNRHSTEKAYVLGRLFSVLEKAQLDASPGIKLTIRDRYFTAASTTPAAVFPSLLMLAQAHIAKAGYGHVSDRRIQALLGKLDSAEDAFPSNLTAQEQGLFMLGYYHQRNANYTAGRDEDSGTPDTQSTERAYVLGRLFSVLEKAQRDANPGIQATIRDRYLTSACTAPKAVFPGLLRLAQAHIAKAEYGYVNDRRIEALLALLPAGAVPFPGHLTLEEQGRFMLGYYHQACANYAPHLPEGDTAPDTGSDRCAYLLGRLFSVLEKVQLDASPGIQATIRDRYFTAAGTTPAAVFPTLLRLSKSHLAKSQYGYAGAHRIAALQAQLGGQPLPRHLTLQEQGDFLLGYYHQNALNYTSVKNKEDAQ